MHSVVIIAIIYLEDTFGMILKEVPTEENTKARKITSETHESNQVLLNSNSIEIKKEEKEVVKVNIEI